MKCTAILGYDKAIYLLAADGRSGWFHPGRSTITGSRDRKGNVRTLTAASVQRFLGISGQLHAIKDSVELDDDKGIFDEIGPVDVWICRKAYNCVDIPVKVWLGAIRLMEDKR